MSDTFSPPPPAPPSRKWEEWTARVGHVAIGVVYVLVGIQALRAAWGAQPQAAGVEETLRRINQQPFGRVWLVIVVVGMAAFIAWRLVEVIQYPGLPRRTVRSGFKRFGFAISGLIYTFFAVTAARAALGWSDQQEANNVAESWARWTFGFPLGAWVIAIIGASVFGTGIGQFVMAHRAGFMLDFDTRGLSAKECFFIRLAGCFGLAARGVTFCIIGIFLAVAAFDYDPSRAKGLGQAFQTVASQPLGTWLLTLVALGFIAYGLYCFTRARYCHFKTA